MFYPPILPSVTLILEAPNGQRIEKDYAQADFLDDVLWLSPKWRESGDRSEMLDDAVERFEKARDSGSPFWEWSDDQQKVASEVLGAAQLSGTYARQVRSFSKGVLRAPMRKPEEAKATP